MIDPDTLITPDWRIHGSVYRDQTIFDAEMTAIFDRCWIYVAHESELAEAGDYKTTHIGIQPVIVSRDADNGGIHVMYNRCRHRGSAVCQHARGSANYFRCSYHGWTYANDGTLTGVPFPDGYGEDIRREELGLVHVPRVDAYKGFIFASASTGGESLTDYLGNARTYLDVVAGLGANGIELSAAAQKLGYDGNWKMQMENTIDPYHFGFVHKSYLKIIENRSGVKNEFLDNMQHNRGWVTMDLGHGHSVHEYGGDQGLNIGIGDINFNLIIFPNLGFVGTQLRLVQPKAADRTEVLLYPILLKGGSRDVNAGRLRAHEGFYGPAGFGSADDVEVAFDRVAEGLKATADDWVVMSRGLSREVVDEHGVRIGRSSDEIPQRALYRQWKSMLSANGERLADR